MSLALQLLQGLAAARAAETTSPVFVSGAALAAEYQVTRSAIWKAMGQLREMGVEVQAITHRGYRLARPASPLDAQGVIARLAPATRARLREGRCVASLASTNTALLERGAPPPGQFDFLTTELQSAGRGRRGRSWLAPPGGAICLSWSWCFEGMASNMGALSLATGVAVARALEQLGVRGVQLKWPNDLIAAGGKLGGVLIELRSEAAGPVHVVTGLGLNVALGESLRAQVSASGNHPVDLAELMPGTTLPSRNALVAAVLDHGVAALYQFAQDGFESFRADYLGRDALRDRPLHIQGGNGPATGTARGVDADGALRIEHAGAIHRILAGEVSVRAGEP
jgi:BirA family biotin operon repressor/biotin-[acetyl-CoA-carboxylase] ligase